jgi:segregation and condensation protein A
MGDEAARSFPRTAGPEPHFLTLAPDLLAGVTPGDLRAAFLRATAPKPVPRVDVRHLHMVQASVSDALAELVDELPRSGPITFRRLTGDLAERLEVVVRFLAILELFKQGLVDLDQVDSFGDITIRWIGDDSDVERVLVGADAYDG